MKARLQHLAAATAVFALFFWRALSPHRFLFRRDAFRLYLPLEEHIARELRAGRLPTWFPGDGLGISLIGSSVAGVLHPRHLLALLLPPDQALKWGMLLAYPLAAWGAWRLVSRLGGGHAARALAALGYALSGYLLSMSDNAPYLLSAATLPLVALAAEALGNRPTWRAAAGLGLALAFTAWSGDVQAALLQALLAVAIALSHTTTRDRLLHLAGSGGLALLLCAPLIPALAATAAVDGRLSGSELAVAMRWSLAPVRLFELVFGAPWPAEFAQLGSAFPEQHLTHAPGGLWAVSVQGGAALTALALVGLFRPRRRVGVVYGTLTLLGLWLALGEHGGLYALLLRLPLWGAFRYPEKLLPFAILGLAVLAGMGTGALIRAGRALALALGSAGLALVALGLAARMLVLRAVPGADPETVEALTSATRTALAGSGLIVLALAAVAWRDDRRLLWLAPALQLLQALPLAGWVVQTADASWLTRASPLRERASALGGRICSDPQNFHFDQPPEGDPYAVSVGAEIDALAPDHGARAGVPDLVPGAPGLPSILRTICAHPMCGGRCERVAGAAGGILDAETFERLQREGAGLHELQRIRDPALVLFADPASRPFAETTAVRFVANAEAVKAGLAARDAKPPAEVLLVGSGSEAPAPSGTVKTTRTTTRPDAIDAEVQLAAPGWVVIREACVPGWSATLDGAPVALSRADLAFCAAPIPAGAHRLELRYRPPGWPWLFIPYGLGLALCAALARKTNGAGH